MERHNLESKMLNNRLKLVTRSERENRNLCLSLTKVAQDDPQIENTDILACHTQLQRVIIVNKSKNQNKLWWSQSQSPCWSQHKPRVWAWCCLGARLKSNVKSRSSRLRGGLQTARLGDTPRQQLGGVLISSVNITNWKSLKCLSPSFGAIWTIWKHFDIRTRTLERKWRFPTVPSTSERETLRGQIMEDYSYFLAWICSFFSV